MQCECKPLLLGCLPVLRALRPGCTILWLLVVEPETKSNIPVECMFIPHLENPNAGHPLQGAVPWAVSHACHKIGKGNGELGRGQIIQGLLGHGREAEFHLEYLSRNPNHSLPVVMTLAHRSYLPSRQQGPWSQGFSDWSLLLPPMLAYHRANSEPTCVQRNKE